MTFVMKEKACLRWIMTSGLHNEQFNFVMTYLRWTAANALLKEGEGMLGVVTSGLIMGGKGTFTLVSNK